MVHVILKDAMSGDLTSLALVLLLSYIGLDWAQSGGDDLERFIIQNYFVGFGFLFAFFGYAAYGETLGWGNLFVCFLWLPMVTGQAYLLFLCIRAVRSLYSRLIR